MKDGEEKPFKLKQPDAFTSMYRYDYVNTQRGQQVKAKSQVYRTYTVNENDEFVEISNRAPHPQPAPFELAEEFLENTFKQKYPKLYAKYFKESLQHDVTEALLRKDTAYTRDYCKHHKEPVKEKREITIEPPQAIETSMQDHYRVPSSIGLVSYKLATAPISILAKNDEVITSIVKDESQSEYNRLIGKMGKFIIDNKMYGEMVYPS